MPVWFWVWFLACPKDKPCKDCDTEVADTDTDVADTDVTDSDTDDASPPDRDADGFPSDVDCNDGDPDVHPDATEVCGDAVDDDCDGHAPACRKVGDLDAQTDAVLTVTGTLDLAEVGYGLARGGDVTGDGIDDLLVGARLADTNGYRAGAVHVLSGTARADVDAAALPTLLGEAGDYAGTGIAFAGDLDGDGNGDLVVGTDRNGIGAGGAYLVYGPVSGTTKLSTRASILTGASDADHAGMFLAGVGDWTGDALDDVFIAAPFDDSPARHAGRVFLIAGDSARPSTRALADAAVSVLTGEAGQVAGYNTSTLGDLNGDGTRDVGVMTAVDGNTELVILTEPPPTGTTPLTDLGHHVRSTDADGLVSQPAGPLGDHDGDGYDDYWVLGWGTTPDTHIQSIFLMNTAGATSLSDAFAIAAPDGSDVGDRVYAAAGDSDGDGDGNPDLVLTLPNRNEWGGAAFLFFGPLGGRVTTADAGCSWGLDEPGAYLGTIATWTGDHDGDGYDELAVAANGLDGGGRDRGALLLFSGAASE